MLTPGAKRGQTDAALHGDLGTILEWAGFCCNVGRAMPNSRSRRNVGLPAIHRELHSHMEGDTSTHRASR